VSGIQDTRSNLLGQITAGLKLKKVDVEREAIAKPSAADVFNVSAILQRYHTPHTRHDTHGTHDTTRHSPHTSLCRRAALEYSDDESEDDEWDDDDYND
jgi:hypothetical protein